MQKALTHSALISLIILTSPSAIGSSANIIVNGATTTFPGGTYDTVYVANEGRLQVNGELNANSIVIDGGSANVNGLINVNSIAVNSGSIRATGTNNTTGSFVVNGGATATLLGNWVIGTELRVKSNALVSIIPHDNAIPFSGRLSFSAERIVVEPKGVVSGDFAGNDPRGRAKSFGDAGGGGHGGNGARGWWSASTQGFAFGDAFSFICDMGSAGGQMGGGAITLVASTLVIDGEVRANGRNGGYLGFQYAPGGGSGGGILIKAASLTLNGSLACDGGNGDGSAGPGAGGRIKVFYAKGGGTNLLAKCSVKQGPNHTDKGPAQAGTVWFDAVPETPELLSPVSGEVVQTNTVFRFTTRDLSIATDGRADALFCVIELSADHFQTVAYRFDQSQSPLGWSKFSYADGDTAEFTAPSSIATGSYRWRAVVRDRSIESPYSEERVVSVNKGTLVAGPALRIDHVVQLSFESKVQKYKVETSSNLTEWSATDVIIDGNGKPISVYLPVDVNARFYRLREL